MKYIIAVITLLASWTQAQSWYLYDANRRVPFLSNSQYTRDEYHWFILNTGEPTRLFLNGVYQSQEEGTNDVGIVDAWTVQYGGLGSIGVVDLASDHGLRVKAVAAMVSGLETRIERVLRLYPDNLAQGISNRVAMGVKVIVVTEGTAGYSANLYNACRYAEMKGAMVFCAVPSRDQDIDVTPDYPSSWASTVTSIVPVTSTDRTGNLYDPAITARGTNCVGAPGRNIYINGAYSSGTSYATPIVAACVALLMEQQPGRTPAEYRQALWQTADQAVGVKRLNAAKLVNHKF